MRKYLILPLCLLILNLVEEVLVYKTELIPNPYQRIAILIILLAFGFAIVGGFLAPRIEKLITSLRRKGKSSAGATGEIIVCLAILGALYYAYFQVYTNGITSVLPSELLN